MQVLQPAWPVADNIIAGVTTRIGGCSKAPFNHFNLASHVGDNIEHVKKNRAALNTYVKSQANKSTLKLDWHWLNQTHSVDVIEATSLSDSEPTADAIWTFRTTQVCAVLTADCLPVLLADRKGRAVSAIHAGWRGLCHGIIGNCIRQICDTYNQSHKDQLRPIDLLAWLGPAIGPQSFEVGNDVYHAFRAASFATRANRTLIDKSFRAVVHPEHYPTTTPAPKYFCDLYQLASIALNESGVKQIYGGGFCTVKQPNQLFSYRRDTQTGRMASYIVRI